MQTGSNPLRTRRLALAGLIAAMALSAGLLWLLGSRSTRARRASTAAPAAAPHAPSLAEPAQSARTAPVVPAEGERAALEAARRLAAAPESADGYDPAAVSGRLVLGDRPVEGATIHLFAGALERRAPRPPLAEARSDAQGRFRFRGLVPHQRTTVLVQCPAALPEERALFPGHEEELVLEPASSVSGTVRSALTHEPLAGIEVSLQCWHWNGTALADRVRSVTDAGGRWQLPWAEPGMQEFLVQRPLATPERRSFQVSPEQIEGYDIELGQGLALEVVFYALESGAPLAGAEVLWDDVPLHTDEHGGCGVPLPPGGFADEWLRLSAALQGGCLTQGRVRLDAPGPVRVPLTRGGIVRGRVVDAAAKPLEGASVRMEGGGRVPAALVLPAGFWLNPARGAARTAADGRFELAGLPPREGETLLGAQHPDHPPGQSTPFAFSRLGQEVELEIVLDSGGTIAGTSQLDGQPAALLVHWSSARGRGWTRANDLGAYLLRGVPAGEVELRARLDDEDEDVPRPEDRILLVEEGRTVTCDLDLSSHSARIRGRVIDGAGAPVAGARIEAQVTDEDAWSGDEPRTRSGPDGRFALCVPDLPGLAFHVLARSGPREALAESVPAGTANLELVLPVLTRVALRVIDVAQRTSVHGFQLYWRDSAQGEFRRLEQDGRLFSPGPDGTFLAELPAGRLDLAVSARAQGYVPARRDGVELFPEGPTALEFELERGAKLLIEFQIPPGEAELLALLQRGRLSIASDEQWRDRERGGDFFQQEVRNAQALRVDGDGRSRVRALASGTYRFLGGPKGHEIRPKRFELPQVAEQRVTATLVRLEKAPAKKPESPGN